MWDKHIGKGPSLEDLIERVNKNPAQLVRMVNVATDRGKSHSQNNPLVEAQVVHMYIGLQIKQVKDCIGKPPIRDCMDPGEKYSY